MYPTNTGNPSHHHVYGQNVHHHQAQHPAYASQAGHHYSSLSAATTTPTDVMDSSSAAAHQAHQLQQQQQQAALYHHHSAAAAHHQHAQRSPAHYAQSIGSGTSSPSSDPEPSFPAPGPSSAGSSRGGKRSPEQAMLSIDAPTQPRRYITPSSTSRKDVPAFFTKRRSASSATSPYGSLHQLQYSDEEDELTEEPPSANATDQEKIEWKRRQNTLAARRSRKRKMMHQQFLEDRVDTLTVEKEVWKTRAQTLRQLLISNGIPCPDWSD